MPKRKNAGKRRRSVRCKICTTFRWMGNSAGRFKHKDHVKLRDKRLLREFQD